MGLQNRNWKELGHLEPHLPNRAFLFWRLLTPSLHATGQFPACNLKSSKRRHDNSLLITSVGTRHPPLSSIAKPASTSMPPLRGKWPTIDMNDIKLCQDLVDELELEYVNEDRTTIISTTPEKIFQNTTITLWARTYLGTKKINLALPSLKTWLGNLVLCGPGRSEMYEGVTYKFVKRWSKSETTTPESTL